MVEHSEYVVHLLGNVYREVGRRRRKAALLVGGDLESVADVLNQTVEIIERETGTPVEYQHRWSTAVPPPGQLHRCFGTYGERFAHGGPFRLSWIPDVRLRRG